MWVWLTMLFSIIIIRFLIPDAIGEKKRNIIFMTLSFVIIVFVVGSRSTHLSDSADLKNYYRFFGRALSETIPQMLESTRFETGYVILNNILAWLVPWNYFIMYFEAAFCTGIMFWYIYRNVDSKFLGVIVYICLGPWQFFLTGFRQAIAVCICFIALECIKKKILMWDLVAVGLILLSTTIHVTAWVFLLVFVIRRIKITKKVVIYATVISLVLLIFIEDIVSFGNDIMEKDYTLSYYGNAFGGLIPILVYVAALILTYLIWTWNNDYLEENGLEVAMLIFGLCIYIQRYSAHIMERVSMYFTPVVVVVLTNALTRQRSSKPVRNIIYVVTIGLCVALFIYRANAQLGEYHFYWEYINGTLTQEVLGK